MEYETEKDAFRQMTEKIGVERRVRRGDAWWPVKAGRSYYNSMNQLVVEITRSTVDDDAVTLSLESQYSFSVWQNPTPHLSPLP